MKKHLIFLLPALALLLTGCGPTTDTSSDTSQDTSGDIPSDTSSGTSTEIDNHQDITIEVSVAGITVLEENAIFFGSVLGGSATVWASTKMTKNDQGKWTLSFDDVEEGYYGYNIYVGPASADSAWDYINSEGTSETPRSLGVLVGTALYPITATFTTQPDSSQTVDFTLNITSSLEITVSNHVWVWNSITNGEVKLEGSGTSWSYDFEDVTLGPKTFTAVLGSATEVDWSYKASDLDSYVVQIEATTTEVNLSATFASQPAEPSPDAYTVNFVLEAAIVGTQWPKVVIDDSWKDMAEGEGDNTWVYSLTNVAPDAVLNFYFYHWAETGGDHKIYDELPETLFSVTVTADITITVVGTFTAGASAGTMNVANTTFTVEVILHAALIGTEWPKIVSDSNWITMAAGEGENTWTYSFVDVEAESEISFYFYHWSTVDYTIYADASSTLFTHTVVGDATLEITGTFVNPVGTGTIA